MTSSASVQQLVSRGVSAPGVMDAMRIYQAAAARAGVVVRRQPEAMTSASTNAPRR
ncbi:hypothetical protein JYQ29_10945 [Curtobacterium flaccumfaciens pv. flaccumfaciens]|uniref:hypothetical protein n=1 Tax=Curtobacterium TaxID=2034 RepID=UPI0015F3E7E6|nr:MULTISPECIES: hypothetical protein [Curtobacterium]MBO9057500.1 hypothetical protein [Curtobacterium flaccumfaciens pv. flaccumfaciens]